MICLFVWYFQPESSFSTPLMQLNIRAARKHFEALEKAVENDNANSKNGR